MGNCMMSIPNVLFRDYQVESLCSYITTDPFTTPPNLFIQGYSSSGKTHVLKAFFKSQKELFYTWLEPVELVTAKSLLQAFARNLQSELRACFPEIKSVEFDALDVEEPYLLVKYLCNFLEQYQGLTKHFNLFIVFDNFDTLQDIDALLMTKFLKMHEHLPESFKIQLKFVYIIQDLPFLHRYVTFGVPTIIFPRYTAEQIKDILLYTRAEELRKSECFQNQLQKANVPELSKDDGLNIVLNFINLIFQAFHPYTGNNIFALNDLIDFKWDQYVQEIQPETVYDPVVLYRKVSTIFAKPDDTFSADFEDEIDLNATEGTTQTYELSDISKYLIIASYICSYIEPKYDSSIFSRKTHLKQGRASYGRRKRNESNPRHLQPSAFTTERLLAIFQAIFPMKRKAQSGTLASIQEEHVMRATVEVFQNLSELHSLKLVQTTVGKNLDFLNYKLKWKVNVPWEMACEIADSVNFDIKQYFSGVYE